MQSNATSTSVFLLPLKDSYLVYAPLHEWSIVAREAKQNGPNEPGNLAAEIRRTFMPSTPNVPKTRTGPFLPEGLGLIPTRGCNLDCRYCGFRSGPGRRIAMPQKLAETCINWYARRLKQHGREIMNIHFFGGEPFVEPEVCRAAVTAARDAARRHGLLVQFEATTNGFMSEETAKFVADSIDFIVLSLDGPAIVQNRYRPRPGGKPSYETVLRNARIFSQSRAHLCIRVCVTAETVDHMQETARWLCAQLGPDSVAFETLQPGPESEHAGMRAPNAWTFARNFIKAESTLDRFGVKTIYATANLRSRGISFCPVGRDVAIVSPDGRISGCYLLEKDWRKQGLDLHLGHVSSAGKILIRSQAVRKLRSLNVTRKPRCAGCFCKWHCAGGCHVHHTFPGCETRYDDLCIQTRIISLYRVLKELEQTASFRWLENDRNALESVILQASDALSAETAEATDV